MRTNTGSDFTSILRARILRLSASEEWTSVVSTSFSLLSSVGAVVLGLNVKLNPLETFSIGRGDESPTAVEMGVDAGPGAGEGTGREKVACGETGVEPVEEDEESAWKLNLSLLGSFGMELGLKPVYGVGRDIELTRSADVANFECSATDSLSLSTFCISTSSISSMVTSLCRGFTREGRT